jgi:hypothetical protein
MVALVLRATMLRAVRLGCALGVRPFLALAGAPQIDDLGGHRRSSP